MSQDQQICSSLEEKLRIYTELSMVNGRSESSMLEPRLLSHHHPEEVPQGATLLSAALKEGETLSHTHTHTHVMQLPITETDTLHHEQYLHIFFITNMLP